MTDKVTVELDVHKEDVPLVLQILQGAKVGKIISICDMDEAVGDPQALKLVLQRLSY